MAGWGPQHQNRLPKDWAKRRKAVFARAGNRCEWVDRYSDGDEERCINPAEECDHMRPLSQGGSHALFNLRALCHAHHALITGRQAAETRPRIQPRNRGPEDHLGSI
jgi:5-methylcytosine-specific restriction endonuclease McrA